MIITNVSCLVLYACGEYSSFFMSCSWGRHVGALYLGGVMTVNRIFLKERYQVPCFEFILEIDRKMLS